MRDAILPAVFLLALSIVGAMQVREALSHPPELILESGLPVVFSPLDAQPQTVGEPCRPPAELLARDLPESVARAVAPGAPFCRELSEITLEVWSEGRFVWRPGLSLTLERW